MEFAAALQAGAAALNLLKDLNEVNKEYDKATLKLKIAEVSSSLMKLQVALGEAQSELGKRDAEIARLSASFKDKSELVDHDGFLYRKGADGKPRGRAYCPRCMSKGLPMMTVATVKAPGHPYECPECKSDYFGISAFAF